MLGRWDLATSRARIQRKVSSAPQFRPDDARQCFHGSNEIRLEEVPRPRAGSAPESLRVRRLRLGGARTARSGPDFLFHLIGRRGDIKWSRDCGTDRSMTRWKNKNQRAKKKRKRPRG